MASTYSKGDRVLVNQGLDIRGTVEGVEGTFVRVKVDGGRVIVIHESKVVRIAGEVVKAQPPPSKSMWPSFLPLPKDKRREMGGSGTPVDAQRPPHRAEKGRPWGMFSGGDDWWNVPKEESAAQYQPLCTHRMGALKVGEWTLYLSSRRGTKEPAVKPYTSIYLDQAWVRDMSTVFTTYPMDADGVLTGQRIAYYPWPDMGVVKVDVLDRLVRLVVKELRRKHGPVEIGCVGGHGRTGTLAAAVVMMVEGERVDAAVKRVRDGYCKEAVESKAQEGLLAEYEAYLKGGERIG